MANRMTSVEIQAFSVEEAIRLALEQLDLNASDVDIEVLSDAGPDPVAEALHDGCDYFGGAGFFESKFGVHMDIPPPGDHFTL